MKAIKTYWMVVLTILITAGITACSSDEFADYKKDGNLKSFTSFTATLDDAAGTRAYLDAEASDGIRRVHWNLSDVIYVYSDTDTELKKYEMTSLSEDDQAVFTGEEVTGNKFYAVYARNREITLDEDNYNIVHFSRAGMTSTYGFHGPLVATATGNALTFKQVIGIIHVTVGNINTIDRVSFSGNNNERIGGKGYVDMSESHPILRLDDDARTVSYSQIFNDSFDEKYTDIYVCIPPTVFEDGFSVRITGKDANDNEFAIDKTFNSRFEVKAGNVSRFSLVDISAELEAQGYYEIIEFADPIVKQICVENWDTNGDGELSYAEAATVMDISELFRDNTDIESFDELQYFTGLKSIGKYAFYNCSNLTSIEIPKGVTSIKYGAFIGCSSLTSIVIPEGVTSIGQWAFNNCSNLVSIVIPESVTSIDNYAFIGCSRLTSIVIPKGVKSIGGWTFQNCVRLTNIVIPEGVTSIGDYALSGCASLNSIMIPEGVTSIGSYAFWRCSSLESIVIPESVTSIGSNAFLECSSLTSIVIPEGVTSIGGSAFMNCSKLSSIEIPASVTFIGEWAFYGCSSLTSVVIPEGLSSIGEWTFAYCSNLASIVIPESVTSIGEGAFTGCSNLTNLVIPDGVKTIGDWAIGGCSSLTNIVIPKGVTSIGNDVFHECSNLTSIVIPKGVTSIGESAFYGCGSLASIEIPEGVTSIGESAFHDCSSLTSVVIPEGVISIGERAFENCSNLISIVIHEGVTSIGNAAFILCTSLTSFTCLAANPPAYDYFFGEDWGRSYSGTIYVPAASVEAYKAADGWKDYASQIQAITE
ncbi:MAG: leucine-rich repeat domain-containing protein [Bacteroidaceae bacterium]|nr:leucine-rich repeat domain-containing protein [Bacteroidaceae bacterium]